MIRIETVKDEWGARAGAIKERYTQRLAGMLAARLAIGREGARKPLHRQSVPFGSNKS